MSEKVLDLLEEMVIPPDEVTYTILFRACTDLSNDRAKRIGKKYLQQIPKHWQNDNILLVSAFNMLMKFGDVKYAEHIFQKIQKKDIVSYNALLKGNLHYDQSNLYKLSLGYLNNDMWENALNLLEHIHLNFDERTYTIVFSACAKLCNDRAKQIGKKLILQMPNHFHNNNILHTSAINMLMRFSDVSSAEQFFNAIKEKHTTSYNVMIKGKFHSWTFTIQKFLLGYVFNNMYDKALDLFEQMPFDPNDVTYTVVLNTCAQLCDDRAKQMGMRLLKQISNRYQNNQAVLTSAIDMLMRFGDVTSAERLFNQMKNKDIISYGALMKGKILA